MADPVPSTSKRLLSLDVFRGATIAGMMLVNNPGDWKNIYAPWEHSAWNGWTFTDVIFPFFLWIVGVAMTLSFAKRVEKGDNKNQLMLHAVRRSFTIFLLGMILAGFPFGLMFGHQFSFLTIRIPGVLQRIAVCYLIGSIIFLTTSIRVQAGIIAGLLAIYWILTAVVPVPGYGAGVLTPMGSLCWYLDSTILAGHTWRGAPVPGFDPEGIFSTIPAIATTLFGILTGHFLRTKKSGEEKSAWMFVAGNLLVLLGLIMDNWLPINKNLWTSTYSVFMAGLALNVFGVCYWLIDVKGFKKWTPFFSIYGLNAITVFFLSGILGRLVTLIRWDAGGGATQTLKGWTYQTFFTPFLSPLNASFAFAIAWMMMLFVISYVMYRRNWIIKV
jgi:predicted acyltransferase